MFLVSHFLFSFIVPHIDTVSHILVGSSFQKVEPLLDGSFSKIRLSLKILEKNRHVQVGQCASPLGACTIVKSHDTHIEKK